jgi:catechol 2,3-dioxygenase-like lactoylglutathione lyase family enzyme
MSAITHLYAGVPVSDLEASIDWYARFFGRPPDTRVGDEVLWEIDEGATLFIEPNEEAAGSGRITFAVTRLDALLDRLAAQRIGYEPVETYSNGVRHVTVPDPDGNASRSPSRPTPKGLEIGTTVGRHLAARRRDVTCEARDRSVRMAHDRPDAVIRRPAVRRGRLAAASGTGRSSRRRRRRAGD